MNRFLILLFSLLLPLTSVVAGDQDDVDLSQTEWGQRIESRKQKQEKELAELGFGPEHIGMYRFCRDNLNAAIQAFISNYGEDTSLLTNYYQLAQMKLTAQVMMDADADKRTLEDLIIKKLKNVPTGHPMRQDLVKLYKRYGITKTNKEAGHLLVKLKKAKYGDKEFSLKGVDAAVVSHLIQKNAPGEHCSAAADDAVCMNESDTAALWLVGRMNRTSSLQTDATKDNLEVARAIAHYTGHAIEGKDHKDKQALDGGEIRDRINHYQGQLKAQIDKIQDYFYSQHSECEQFFGKNECFHEKVQSIIPENFEFIAQYLGEDHEYAGDILLETREGRDGEGKEFVSEIVLNGIRAEVGLDAKFVEKVKAHQESELKRLTEKTGLVEELVGHTVAWEKEEVGMCGDQLFRAELKDQNTFGFDTGGFKGGAQSIGRAGKFADRGTNSMMAANRKGGGNISKSKWLSFTEKFYIPGPMFRCAAEPVLKPPFMSVKTADKKVCCNQNPEWRKMVYLFFTGSAGFSCRAFVGIPYIAEVGVKAGAGITVTGGGGTDPNKCENEACGQLSVLLDVSAGLYGELVAGAASVQGTVAWQPNASLRQCGIERWGKGLPPARFNYKIGIITFTGTAKVGWVASYHVTKVLYSSGKSIESDIALF